MSFEYINEYYGKEFKKGLIVKADGKLDVITGTHAAYVKVKLSGEKHAGCYHPSDVIIPEETKDN